MENNNVVICKEASLVLADGTLVTPDEFGNVWFHPLGVHGEGSFRVCVRMKLVDVIEGGQVRWIE